jgi:phage terminase large subunit GpA-like protein
VQCAGVSNNLLKSSAGDAHRRSRWRCRCNGVGRRQTTMLLPEEATQRQPSCLAKHCAMDDKRCGTVVRPRSVDQADDVRVGDDDSDVDARASR